MEPSFVEQSRFGNEISRRYLEGEIASKTRGLYTKNDLLLVSLERKEQVEAKRYVRSQGANGGPAHPRCLRNLVQTSAWFSDLLLF